MKKFYKIKNLTKWKSLIFVHFWLQIIKLKEKSYKSINSSYKTEYSYIEWDKRDDLKWRNVEKASAFCSYFDI